MAIPFEAPGSYLASLTPEDRRRFKPNFSPLRPRTLQEAVQAAAGNVVPDEITDEDASLWGDLTGLSGASETPRGEFNPDLIPGNASPLVSAESGGPGAAINLDTANPAKYPQDAFGRGAAKLILEPGFVPSAATFKRAYPGMEPGAPELASQASGIRAETEALKGGYYEDALDLARRRQTVARDPALRGGNFDWQNSPSVQGAMQGGRGDLAKFDEAAQRARSNLDLNRAGELTDFWAGRDTQADVADALSRMKGYPMPVNLDEAVGGLGIGHFGRDTEHAARAAESLRNQGMSSTGVAWGDESQGDKVRRLVAERLAANPKGGGISESLLAQRQARAAQEAAARQMITARHKWPGMAPGLALMMEGGGGTEAMDDMRLATIMGPEYVNERNRQRSAENIARTEGEYRVQANEALAGPKTIEDTDKKLARMELIKKLRGAPGPQISVEWEADAMVNKNDYAETMPPAVDAQIKQALKTANGDVNTAMKMFEGSYNPKDDEANRITGGWTSQQRNVILIRMKELAGSGESTQASATTSQSTSEGPSAPFRAAMQRVATSLSGPSRPPQYKNVAGLGAF